MHAARPLAWHPAARRSSAIDKPQKARKTTAWRKIGVVVA
jgi:hypothetical protein